MWILAGSFVVGIFVGVYRFNRADEIELAVTYYGQGVEGERARRWRPPDEFVRRAERDTFHVVLWRPPDFKAVSAQKE